MNIRISILCIALIAFFTGAALASSEDDIVYPVGELGDCGDEQECRAYCNGLAHIDECLAFAEQHNLLSPEEIAEARKFAEIGVESGPGGCGGNGECEVYCEDISHINECLAFAEEHDILDMQELEEARRVVQALREGAQLPGGCTSKDACEAYCEDASHIQECVAFAEVAGFMSAEELGEAKMVLRALEGGAKLPGGCQGKAQCEAYCSESSHMEECFEFAVAAGFMKPDEIEEARKMMPFMTRGEMPGGCRSRQECEAYCFQGSHTEECVTFFEQAGVMNAEDAKLFRKTGGRGPGECRGKEECDVFCNDPANQQICFDFAKQHGLIEEDELRNMEEGIGMFREGFQNAPPEVAQCLKARIGEEVLSKIEAGTFLPNQELGKHMRGCFEEFMPRGEQGDPMRHEGESRPGGEGDFDPSGGRRFGPHPEASDCVQRILSGHSGPPTPEQEARMRQECFSQSSEGFEGGLMPSGAPEGFPEGFQEQFQEQFQQQYQEEFQRQYEQQYQEEFQRQMEQQSSGGFQPPGGEAPMEFHPEEPAPTSRLLRESFFGAVWEAMKPGLSRFIPFF